MMCGSGPEAALLFGHADSETNSSGDRSFQEKIRVMLCSYSAHGGKNITDGIAMTALFSSVLMFKRCLLSHACHTLLYCSQRCLFLFITEFLNASLNGCLFAPSAVLSDVHSDWFALTLEFS